VGRTSAEVGIRVEHPDNPEGEPTAHIASCYFTMVVRSPDGSQSLLLPPFEPEDELAKTRWAKAADRRDAYRRTMTDARRPPNDEDFELLSQLHAAQEAKGFSGVLARQLQTSGWERMFPEHENVPRKVFGGYLIRKAYEQSTICAELIAPHRPILVGVNRINFNQPVRIGDRLHFQSRVVYTGHCSICVETDIFRVSRDRVESALSNTCVFTFINVDAELKGQPVPPIYPTTYREDASYLAARRRQAAYREWKAAGKP
jgi:acyl-CoA hydrolase